MTRGWATGILAAVSLAAAARAAVTVNEPSRGLQVIAGRTYTVEWEGTPLDSKVEIDLYYCGDNCDDPDSCGDFVAELCGYHQNGGCPHIFGELDVTMPEPKREKGLYKVQVTDADDRWNSGCSGAFSLRSAEDTPEHDDPDGAYLEVVSPMEHDGAVAGEEYTVEFFYDNGVGSRVDRFKIDLYRADGKGAGKNKDGDCGEWITSVCDKPDIGCKDSTGDYDVEIPRGTPPGEYSIRVGRFEDDSLYSCSGRFSIVRDSSKFDDDEEGGNRGDFYREGGYLDSEEEEEGEYGRGYGIDQSYSYSYSYSFDYGFYFEDDDLADEWWRSDDHHYESSDDSSKGNGRKGDGSNDNGNKNDDSSNDNGSKNDDSVDSVDDDDSVSAGDEVESPPSDGWFWDDDWSRDDVYSYGHDDYSYSHSYDFRAEHIAYGWPVGKNAS